jgi:hypothetical protein
MTASMNPYFLLRNKELRKAAKHYRRAVQAHYMGIWLDQVNDMTKKMHEDIEHMHAEYKAAQKQEKKRLKELNRMLNDIDKRLDYW